MLANLSLKNKLLLTILPLTLLVYSLTVLLVYQSSKRATESQAEAAMGAIVQQQASEIEAYFEAPLHSARFVANMLAGQEGDSRLAGAHRVEDLLGSLLQDSAQARVAWWRPSSTVMAPEAYWMRDVQGLHPLPVEQGHALLAQGDGEDGRREAISSPRQFPPVGAAVILLRVPVVKDGRLLGTLGIGLDAEQLQARVARIHPLGVGVAALTANDTTLVAHPDPSRVGRKESETEADFLGEHLQAMIDAVRNGQSLTLRFISPAMGEEIFMLAVPVRIGDTATPWSFGAALPSAAVLSGARALALRLLLLGCVAALSMCGMIFWLGKAMARPLDAVVKSIRQLAEGDADLGLRLPVRGRDEPALLSKEVNGFLGSMALLVQEIQRTGQTLQHAAGELQEQSESSGRSVDAQREEVEQLATAMQQVSVSVEEVAAHAERAAQATREGDEMVACGQAIVAGLSASIVEGAGTLERIAELSAQLASAGQEIGSVVAVIRAIAEQTNLLALNAAIESARAGAQGRGFAVVADEVRALAQRTHSSTEEVSQRVQMIQERTRTVVGMLELSRDASRANVASASKAGEALLNITRKIGEIREMSQQIATATGQQAATSEQLSRSLVRIADSAEHTSSSTGQVNRRSQDLRGLAAQLNAMVSRFRL